MATKAKKIVLMTCGAEVLRDKANEKARARLRKLGAFPSDRRGTVEYWALACKR